MPDYYIQEMKNYGYDVRIFSTIDDYISQNNHASIRYFTRLQIERLGEDLLKLESSLRFAISIREEHLQMIDIHSIHFYHPLPRHKITPELPVFLDNYPCNGREKQSANGMFMRIILLGAAIGIPHVVD